MSSKHFKDTVQCISPLVLLEIMLQKQDESLQEKQRNCCEQDKCVGVGLENSNEWMFGNILKYFNTA